MHNLKNPSFLRCSLEFVWWIDKSKVIIIIILLLLLLLLLLLFRNFRHRNYRYNHCEFTTVSGGGYSGSGVGLVYHAVKVNGVP